MPQNRYSKNLYKEVACGNEAQRSIDTNSKPDYREGLEAELKALRESENVADRCCGSQAKTGKQLIRIMSQNKTGSSDELPVLFYFNVINQ